MRVAEICASLGAGRGKDDPGAVLVLGAFWIYAAMCVTMLLFVWCVTPETKGKTLEEIEEFWR